MSFQTAHAFAFSLAVTLWELLTGRRPFDPEHLRESWPRTLAAFTGSRHAGP